MTILRTLFDHCDWAHERLLGFCSPLDDEQLDQPFEIGHGSLRAVLHHLWWAERVWLNRWIEKADTPGASGDAPRPNLSVADLAGRFRTMAAERNEFLDLAGASGESRRIAFVSFSGDKHSLPLGDMMLHVCNHAVHHRAQALHMLRRLGATPENLDFIVMRIGDDDVPASTFDVDTIAEFYRYGDWATARIHRLLDGLGPAELDQPFPFGVGSLRRTMLHVQDAEASWLDLWLGRKSGGFVELPVDTPVDVLVARTAGTRKRRNELIDALSSLDLTRIVRARPGLLQERTVEMGDTMIQLCGHGTHHRAQAVNMLRHLGAELPILDYLWWFQNDRAENDVGT